MFSERREVGFLEPPPRVSEVRPSRREARTLHWGSSHAHRQGGGRDLGAVVITQQKTGWESREQLGYVWECRGAVWRAGLASVGDRGLLKGFELENDVVGLESEGCLSALRQLIGAVGGWGSG